MVFAGTGDGGFHKAGKRGKNVDWGVDAAVVQGTVDEDLAFGDVSCQVRDGMGNV